MVGRDGPTIPAVPDDAPWTTVLDLAQLRVEVRRGSGLPVSQPWFEVRLHADSSPFRGTVDSAWFVDDLQALRVALAGLAGADGEVSFTVGGNRAAELRISGGPTITPGRELWMTARVTPNGDDPYPSLTMLLYEEPERLVSRVGALDAVLATLETADRDH